MDKLVKLAEVHPVEGFWKCYYRLRNDGEAVNHKKLHRIYKKIGLPLRRKVKKRILGRVKEPLAVPADFTKTWSIDFVTDSLSNGTKFRSFNVIDDFNREVLFIETDYSLKSSRVLWVLKHLINRHGKPEKIRMDNGPEFVAKIAQKWSEMHQVEFKYIQPGKPMQNGYIERFNKTYRDAVLDAFLFDSLDEVREATQIFVEDYNINRPHDALGGISPAKFREMAKLKQERSQGIFSTQASPSFQISLANNNTNTKELSTFDLY